ncbi:SepM family pheromone-processing serine protease [Vagococcus intermedius]|uniref:endopeptidase La n=1 Tax=Vagococcus intermedius TaxID=2991418 RepID=A0AAF0CUD5_9ENTE|nr:SepM family pheromone-processing serine protease [Vagococcus intermedius]WEG72892.1 PDZ domain-containing protein [Vagococcus intermedius]WEG74979.1 PDZ domain-containing protein [Vagococcus intermedius]
MAKKYQSKHRRDLIKYSILIGISLLAILSVLVPLPYYIEMPGSAEDTKNFVTVDGKRDKQPGSFMLTTVGIQRGTLASLATAKLSSFQDIISQDELMGDSTDDEYDQLSNYEMTSSTNMAKKVALDLAKKPYKISYDGAYVMTVQEQSDFYDKLEPGDILYQVNDKKFKKTDDFMNYIKKQKLGQRITIHFFRDGNKEKAEGKIIDLPDAKKVGIGVTLTEQTSLKTKQDLEINVDDIGGPSAGLMFTLSLYQLLEDQDLRKGRDIAGTGTIMSDGTVGPIGGIDKKVVAADKAGATVFFAPNDEIDEETKKVYPDVQTNYEEAKEAAQKIKSKMKIIPVKTAEDALTYLKSIK